MTPLDPQKLSEFNLRVLRQVDEEIAAIVFSSAHVSTYSFEINTNTWVCHAMWNTNVGCSIIKA